MDTLGASGLWSLSTDHVKLILAHLKAKDVCKLLIIGNKRIYQLIIASTTSLELNMIVIRPFSFPQILSRFCGLLSLHFRIIHSKIALSVSHSDFLYLPKSLTTFTFNAGTHSWNFSPSQTVWTQSRAYNVDLGSVLPNLTKFSWIYRNPRSIPSGPSFHEFLSPNLASLDLSQHTVIPVEVVNRIPRSITSLALNVTTNAEMKVDDIRFPPTLTHLKWSGNNPTSNCYLEYLPSSLVSLAVKGNDMDAKTVQKLPLNLLELKMEVDTFDCDIALALPPQLTTLHLRCPFPYHSDVYPLLPRTLTEYCDWTNPLSSFLTVENLRALPQSLTTLPNHLMRSLPAPYWQHLPRRVVGSLFSIVPNSETPILPHHFSSDLPQFLTHICISGVEAWMVPLLPVTLERLDLLILGNHPPNFSLDPIWLNRFPKLHTLYTPLPVIWDHFGDVTIRLKSITLSAPGFTFAQVFGLQTNLGWAKQLQYVSWSLDYTDCHTLPIALFERANISLQHVSHLVLQHHQFASSGLEFLPRRLQTLQIGTIMVDGQFGYHLTKLPPHIQHVRFSLVVITEADYPTITTSHLETIPKSLIYLTIKWSEETLQKFSSSIDSCNQLLQQLILVLTINE